ncbi:RusA family crossover junction endodeoxyribonuclease [Oscillatoria sp. CS-180]|uniref:RusA family crossover junction endodeoxyribonuclease n=1 Tax=Oscillatoria sp. CS-180 TaxID=3021720 RepID=UPI002330C985|nr:RusA family crossover junction endodeoxyribonuclease [Oscillatoria sp. CS-180]MDB9528289.1 RusA family crossover junction endodeoxyribonuclease [Oscillatoria sp. CS-180]
MLPFEFILTGRPISNQTKDKSKLQVWIAAVRRAANQSWPNDNPVDDNVRIKLTHYFDTPSGKEENVPDSDNIVKPIRAALTGIVYEYDYQVTDVTSRRRNLNGSFRVKGISLTLAEGFIKGEEFVHVMIEVAPDPSDLR